MPRRLDNLHRFRDRSHVLAIRDHGPVAGRQGRRRSGPVSQDSPDRLPAQPDARLPQPPPVRVHHAVGLHRDGQVCPNSPVRPVMDRPQLKH